MNDKFNSDRLSEFLQYLATSDLGDNERLPPLSQLSKILGIIIASLR